jgi:hypothetical protein
MRTDVTYYYLYCINFQCTESVTIQSPDFILPFTEFNLLMAHKCKACGRPLISAMEIELGQILAELLIRLPNKSDCNKSY